MSDAVDPIDDDAMTLDPPGSIAVVGAGPLGIEAALYGRFLGYDVTVIEAVAIAHSMQDQHDLPLPMLPGRCLSPLALSALSAQHGDTAEQVSPMTYGGWINDGLEKLAATDLLRGRIRLPRRVSQIANVPIEADEPDEDTSEIPPDFRLTLVGEGDETKSIDVESVILAIGLSSEIPLGFELPAPYFFRIAAPSTGDHEQDLLSGYHQIVAIFAELAGRADLDLYRPRRV
jgi:hypothetical protein